MLLPLRDRVAPRALHITPLEKQVLQLLADGDTTAELAGRLGVSRLEADTLVTRLFGTIGAGTRAEAVAAARKRGLLRRDPAGEAVG